MFSHSLNMNTKWLITTMSVNVAAVKPKSLWYHPLIKAFMSHVVPSGFYFKDRAPTGLALGKLPVISEGLSTISLWHLWFQSQSRLLSQMASHLHLSLLFPAKSVAL